MSEKRLLQSTKSKLGMHLEQATPFSTTEAPQEQTELCILKKPAVREMQANLKRTMSVQANTLRSNLRRSSSGPTDCIDGSKKGDWDHATQHAEEARTAADENSTTTPTITHFWEWRDIDDFVPADHRLALGLPPARVAAQCIRRTVPTVDDKDESGRTSGEAVYDFLKGQRKHKGRRPSIRCVVDDPQQADNEDGSADQGDKEEEEWARHAKKRDFRKKRQVNRVMAGHSDARRGIDHIATKKKKKQKEEYQAMAKRLQCQDEKGKQTNALAIPQSLPSSTLAQRRYVSPSLVKLLKEADYEQPQETNSIPSDEVAQRQRGSSMSTSPLGSSPSRATPSSPATATGPTATRTEQPLESRAKHAVQHTQFA